MFRPGQAGRDCRRRGWRANAVDDGQEGDRAAGEEAGSQADDKGIVVLVDAVNDTNDLQNAEAAESDERDPLIALFAPNGEGLGNKEHGVSEQGESEDEGDDFFHALWSHSG